MIFVLVFGGDAVQSLLLVAKKPNNRDKARIQNRAISGPECGETTGIVQNPSVSASPPFVSHPTNYCIIHGTDPIEPTIGNCVSCNQEHPFWQQSASLALQWRSFPPEFCLLSQKSPINVIRSFSHN